MGQIWLVGYSLLPFEVWHEVVFIHARFQKIYLLYLLFFHKDAGGRIPPPK